MSYESVMPAAEHPGLAESITLGIGPEQLHPDPLVVVRPRPAEPSSPDAAPQAAEPEPDAAD